MTAKHTAAATLAFVLAAASACQRPSVGERVKPSGPPSGPSIAITGATIDGAGHVALRLALTNDGLPVPTVAAAGALQPMFTLAALSKHPVDGLAAWKSLVLTGATLASLPPGGPGTPSEKVLANVKQPGAESGGALTGGEGEFTYVYAATLPAGFDPTETLRAGVWLLGSGKAAGTSTFDFRPAGGAPSPRDTVLDANCGRCHGSLLCSPRGAAGVKICLTCHTWQNADPDTTDPAALYGSSAATDPNPLDFGRMVHRIHRGKWLPTLYASSSSAPAPALPAAAPPPLPFLSSRTSGTTPANPPIVGRKYSIVGPQSHERVFARVVERRDNNQPPKTSVAGIVFPRDYRDCGACHAGAPQEYEVVYGISRRTCHGCHPEIWFAPPNADGTTSIVEPAPAVHFAHTGGPMPDDTRCAGCHISATATATEPKVYAPIADAHVVPRDHQRHSRPRLEVVSVSGMVPGGAPTVRFKLADRVGPISPPNAPTPAADTATPASPVPRAMYSLRVALAGPTVPDYAGPPIASSDTGNPNALTLVADAQGVLTYTFASKLPDSARGTWAVVVEGRRRGATQFYDVATDTFGWPYTGETVTESPDNVVAYVDVAAGTWPGGGAPVPRRRVVSQAKCLRCHARFESHGSNRHEIENCVTCHTPDRTDWPSRPKWPAGTALAGNVNLSSTFDGIEERSVQMKVMIHRLHTGGRKGTAALDLLRPYSSNGTSANFREGVFPNDLANCTLCHEGDSYRLESVPADAPPTRANESATILHAAASAHPASEPATPAVSAACLGCHATAYGLDRARRHTVDGVEQCAQCHVRGTLSNDVAHGLASPGAAPVAASFSAIEANVIVPRCASGACHGGSPPPAFPQLDAGTAYDAMVDVPSQQASGIDMVEPFEPARSYLVLKLRGEAASVGGVATPMPIGDALLEPSEIAAVEAWIAAGAPRE